MNGKSRRLVRIHLLLDSRSVVSGQKCYRITTSNQYLVILVVVFLIYAEATNSWHICQVTSSTGSAFMCKL